jgi:hypothetical protein
MLVVNSIGSSSTKQFCSIYTTAIAIYVSDAFVKIEVEDEVLKTLHSSPKSLVSTYSGTSTPQPPLPDISIDLPISLYINSVIVSCFCDVQQNIQPGVLAIACAVRIQPLPHLGPSKDPTLDFDSG